MLHQFLLKLVLYQHQLLMQRLLQHPCAGRSTTQPQACLRLLQTLQLQFTQHPASR